jgi:hypothetical protein
MDSGETPQIRIVMDETGLDAASLGAALNVSRRTVEKWFQRGIPPRQALALKRKFGYRPEWLMRREGPKKEYSPAPPPSPTTEPSNAVSLARFFQDRPDNFERLTDDEKAFALATAKSLSKVLTGPDGDETQFAAKLVSAFEDFKARQRPR